MAKGETDIHARQRPTMTSPKTLYPDYSDEAEFRSRFVIPLLARLGFFGIAELHGQREFGKDVVFAELTPFGLLRYSAIQTKHSATITQTQAGEVGALMEQVRQAFFTPFRLPDSPRDRYVSSVFVLNSGLITDGARDYFLDAVAREHFGDNVHFIDGPRLIEIARAGAYAVDRDTQRKLRGLQSQATLNRAIWEQHLAPSSGVSGMPTLMSAVEAFLTAPYAQEWLDTALVLKLWQQAAIIETFADRARFTPQFETLRAQERRRLKEACAAALSSNEALLGQIESALVSLAAFHREGPPRDPALGATV